jgi:adenylylsulfate kinase-like enzyme
MTESTKEGTGWAIWFVGLPGSGKSAIARAVYEALMLRGMETVHLEMDKRRKAYCPKSGYTPEERDLAYDMFVEEARRLTVAGSNVLMDGTANKLTMRAKARRTLDRFAEIHVDCALETAMERERKRPEGLIMAGLYENALERQRTGKEFPRLGEVVGVDVPFEADAEAEMVLLTDELSVEEACDKVVKFIILWNHAQKQGGK